MGVGDYVAMLDMDKSKRKFLMSSVGLSATVFTGCSSEDASKTALAISYMNKQLENPGELSSLVEVDIGKITIGQMVVIEWRKRPIWVVRRSKTTTQYLNDQTHQTFLKDPNSNNMGQQPSYAKNVYRSRKPEYLIVEGVCTHLGCSPKHIPGEQKNTSDKNWKGGYICPCHVSKYDLAGRVFQGSPAPSNMLVPPHYYSDEFTLVIGKD